MPALRHLVYASSSSVYGANRALPFRETDRVDTPLSLYAATKRADELMSHAYAHLFGLPADRVAVFYRLRAVGPAGHGVFQLCQRRSWRASRSRFTTTAG